MIVVDASALLELLLRSAAGAAVEARIFAPNESLHAPELVDLEVAQVLRRYERAGTMSAQRAEEALDDLAALPLERYPHRPLLARVWELRPNLTAYDAAYIALAELLEAPLLTSDGALARSPHRARVELAGG